MNNEFPDASRCIELVINKIQKNLLHQRFKNWIEQDQPDLIEGWVLVTQLQYPGVKLMDVKSQLNDIKLDAWLLMGNVENDLDRIQILNHVFLNYRVFMAIRANITIQIIHLLIECWKGSRAIQLVYQPFIYRLLNIWDFRCLVLIYPSILWWDFAKLEKPMGGEKCKSCAVGGSWKSCLLYQSLQQRPNLYRRKYR